MVKAAASVVLTLLVMTVIRRSSIEQDAWRDAFRIFLRVI
jgi:hypothetical protein